MSNDTDNTGSSSLLSSITRMLDTSVTTGTGLDSIITIISLLCLFSIMTRTQAVREPQQIKPATTSNPLHKLLGDLAKGGDGGGFSPDTLLSLLPLLNNPQLKSKLNPSTIGTVMGLINNLGGLGGSNPPHEKGEPETKGEPHTKASKQPTESEPPPPANAVQQPPLKKQPPPQPSEDVDEAEEKNYGRYLNWKNNF
ncbi:hypothetical protein [Sporomusa sp. KB1]|uniref:hypothetical protein n=1 Tax=Sporomusa sp. KB1 TaxID=943346 RepID=UPI0011A7D60D|nr:hypothetical protein [Sporomusa sp. KB1]TWH48866.1 hypothetical protein Salpa_5054 [Sporomusa sp. KB1]